MMRLVLVTLLFVFGGVCFQTTTAAESSLPVAIPSQSEILAKVRKGHPRLLATERDFTALKQRIATDPLLKKWDGELLRQAQAILPQPPSKYEIPDGLRLLSTSRRVVDRVYSLGLMYRLHGDRALVERAWKELEAAANFTNWNPRHFLDTAEMTHAFAIGYDWLYEVWTPEQRETLRKAMVQKGLLPARDLYRKQSGFTRAHHNWNQVCNGGIGVGALALGEVEPELAGEILEGALKSIQRAMVEFGPDGAWNEGPGYWHYATRYNVAFLAALETALGTDFGLAGIKGFGDTPLFPIYVTGPSGRTFNYADGGDGGIVAPQMFWFARRFNQPVFTWYQLQKAGHAPQDLLWFPTAPKAVGPLAANLSTAKYFRESEVSVLRSAWEDPDALFVAFKAGDNKANHGHLDVGTFVLDALGVRWGVDLGADDYNLPGFFGSQRWNYYRLRTEAHNTLVLNPDKEPDQDPRAATKIIRFQAKPQRPSAVADLTPAYAKHARKVHRGIALTEPNQVIVQDEVEPVAPAELWWFFSTPARITLGDDSRTATLRLDNKQLRVSLLSPAKAAFQVMEAKPLPTSPNPAGQRKNGGIQKLAIHLTGVTDTRIAVTFTPERAGTKPEVPEVKPLSEW